jgi:hypothetical protein
MCCFIGNSLYACLGSLLVEQDSLMGSEQAVPTPRLCVAACRRPDPAQGAKFAGLLDEAETDMPAYASFPPPIIVNSRQRRRRAPKKRGSLRQTPRTTSGRWFSDRALERDDF